jgi:Uma2 family endonuclease
MNAVALASKPRTIVYPESDGQPMAENTVQFEWIATIKGNLEDLFRDDGTVFVAGDLFWYPVEGHPEIRQAPDVFAAQKRPKGDRSSYRQWEEGGVPPTVVFEILSPSNRALEMSRKFTFYEHYGVSEYYLYDPDANALTGWERRGERLIEITAMHGWISPRLGIRFEWTDETLLLYRPNGSRFLSFVELARQRDELREQSEQALQENAALKKRIAELQAQLGKPSS